MQRTIYHQLVRWKQKKHRKPLILRGARQVGKTWLMKAFGSSEFPKTAYINLEKAKHLQSLFLQDFNIARVIAAFQLETNLKIDSNTLIILDEIQEAKGAITCLKYFHEDAPQYYIIGAGSLLGVALHQGISFPVGKVEFLDLYPLDFYEFLQAAEEEAMVELLKSQNWLLIKTFREKLIQHLKTYYFVGGMPEAVVTFLEDGNFETTREVQQNILRAYELDFSKHAPSDAIPRIRMLWNAIPAQLAKENKKFVYGLIKTGARAKEYEMALSWLIDCGLVHKIFRISKPAMPLKAYQDPSAFKLFIVDVGLLGAMSNISSNTLLKGNSIFQEFKGALTEQYVLQQLITTLGNAPHYWSANRGMAEVDFVIQHQDQIIPIEVKAEENLQAKSLKSYVNKYQSSIVIRTSMSDYRQENWLTNYPLYAIKEIVEG